MSKRKLEATDDSNTKIVNIDEKSGFLNGLPLFLHPAALGLTRKKIFERQIVAQGGILISDLRNVEHQKVVVLFESSSIEDSKLTGLIDKCETQNIETEKIYVKSSWLSECLEKNQLLPFEEFILKAKVRKHVTPQSSPSVGPAPSSDDDKIIKRISTSKFVCSQSSVHPTSDNLNEAITSELQKLAQTYKDANDRWRALGYEKAINAIKRHPKAITTRDEAAKIPGVGSKMADKIVEILSSGSLQKVSEVCHGEKAQVINIFNRVWGAGPASAELWYQQGCRTLDDLRTKATLNRNQRIGLQHFDDLDERMERSEAAEIEEYVKTVAGQLRVGLEVIACGSYRRGKSNCGDLDILITHKEDSVLKGFFDQLLAQLRAKAFLTDDLVVQKDGNQRKYLGVCKLPKANSKHRRLDIIVVPHAERAPALLYFTGSAHFNRSMRLLASKMGMSLSEHSLRTGVVRRGREKINSGTVLHTPTEESIFDHLKLPYREPHERDH